MKWRSFSGPALFSLRGGEESRLAKVMISARGATLGTVSPAASLVNLTSAALERIPAARRARIRPPGAWTASAAPAMPAMSWRIPCAGHTCAIVVPVQRARHANRWHCELEMRWDSQWVYDVHFMVFTALAGILFDLTSRMLQDDVAKPEKHQEMQNTKDQKMCRSPR